MSASRQVLWVDDDGRKRFLFEERLLSSAGWSIRWAEGVTEAAQQLASQAFDAVIVDQLLPLSGSVPRLEENLSVWGGCLLLYWLRGRPLPGHVPAPSGFTALYELAPLPSNRTARVVLVTAFFDEEVDEVMRAASPQEQDFRSLLKPLDGSELLEQLERTAAAPAATLDLAIDESDHTLARLLSEGEGLQVEFRSTLRWDRSEERSRPELERAAVKTVAGFLNSRGGTLLLGVAYDGTPLGLESDYAVTGDKGRDGFSLFLTDLLLNTLGKDLAPCLTPHFHKLQDKDLCRLEIHPSPRPVFVKEGSDEVLYLRTGTSTQRLYARKLVDFVDRRWGRN